MTNKVFKAVFISPRFFDWRDIHKACKLIAPNSGVKRKIGLLESIFSPILEM